MNRTHLLHFIAPRLLCLMLTGLFITPAVADTNPVSLFSALRAAPTNNDLPGASAESGGALGGRMRPELPYPTLHLDERQPRQVQAAKPPQHATSDTRSDVEILVRRKPGTPTASANSSGAPLSDFELLVQQTLGYTLPRFGQDLFAANQRGFEPVTDINVPADFVIGPGDEIYLRAWGSIDVDYRVTVDRSGMITIPKVGDVPVSGVRFDELRKHLQAAIARSFHGFDLSVSLGQLHSIRLYVTGFARSPGSYTVSALSSLVNVLFYAGGPATAGDLRHIELHRAGQLVTTIDMYDFLLNGRHDNDLRLQPEDVIHIPALQRQAAIAGAVNRPGIYQMRAGGTLSALLAYAGETSVAASTHRVVLERMGAENQRIVEEYPLDDSTLQLTLRDGDLVLIQPVSPRFQNVVTLRGHVAQPLRHQWTPGLRIADLLPSAAALISPGFWLARQSRNQVVELLNGTPDTAVAVTRADINWEYAVIERIDPATLRTELVPVHLEKAILDRDPEHNLELQPGDQLTVFAIDDLRTRAAQRPRFVRIEGEVMRAGIYMVDTDATLAEVIAIAGGLTPESFLYGIELQRDAVRLQQRLRMDEAVDRLEQDYQRHLIERSRNVLTGDMSLAIPPEAVAIKTLIDRLRNETPTGRIILDLAPRVHDTAQLPKLVLADGDTIFVPARPATIEVVGALFRQGSIIYGPTTVRHYLDKAGLLATADRRNLYLIRADGSFHKVGRKTALIPGDTIIVPEKVDRESTVRRIKDWTQVLYQFGLGTAGLALLGGL